MFCEKCGAQLEANVSFCSVCGQVVVNQQSAEPLQPTQQYDYNQNLNNNLGDFGGNNTDFGNNSFSSSENTSYLNASINNASQSLTGNQSYDNTGNQSYGNTGNAGFYNDGLNANNGFDNFAYNNNPYNNNNTYSNNGFDNNGFNSGYNMPGYTQVGQTYIMPEPKKKGKVFIGLAIALVLVGALVGLFFGVIKPLFDKNTPASKVITALGDLNKHEAVDMTAKIKLEMDGIQGAVLDDFAFVINGKANQAEKKGSFDIAVNFKDNSLANINVYYDEKIVMLSSDELFEDTLYIDVDELKELLEDSQFADLAEGTSTVNFEAYQKLAKELEKDKNFKTVSDRYEKFFKKTLNDFIKENGKVDVKVVEAGKEKTIKCEELTLTINDKFISKVILGLLKEISEDKELKALVKERFPQLLEAMKESGQTEYSGFDIEEYEDFMENFDSNWDNAMRQLKQILDSELIEKGLESFNFSTEVVFRLDNKDRLRQFVFDIDLGEMAGDLAGAYNVDGSIITEITINGYDKDVVIDKLSEDGAVNLAEMNEFELMSLMGEIQENLESIFSDNLNLDF